MNKPHGYGLEVLHNPGGREQWMPEHEMGTWPDFDGAKNERDAYIESGYAPEHVRIVAFIHVEESVGEEDDIVEEDADDPNLHKRFSYGLHKSPHEECPGSTFIGTLKHECDLPKIHVTRHQCGMCGMMF